MKEHDPHSSPIKSPKQLVIVVLLAFIIPITVIGLISQLVTGVRVGSHESDKEVLSRIRAAGHVVVGEAAPPKGTLAGDAVYGQVCKTCHEAGLAGAPKIGDKAAWQPRIAQGEQTLVQHAISGFQGKSGVMPPKGGNPDLTDEEVHRAVVYLADHAGATWKEPAPAATATASASAAPPTANPAATATAAPAAAPAPAGPAPTSVASASGVPAAPAPGATQAASASSAAEGK